MLVRMLVGLSGLAYSLGPGDERDFPQDEALRLISAGFAAPVAEIKIERAVQVPAAERRGRKRNVVYGDSFGSGNG
ncbi:hypothetical protein [Mesorhizobium sp.]|uniref:hypothetical protein n=1 Tax=Mesorhizobium sp. TaxID=1871066 RepID=UPI000FE8DF61|nr:hypothetical protein [Mesorhizobium sp.]RWN58751.1 MAG: hypothetical protein EOS00_20400 [Mesorhizobium sp.]